MDALKRAADSFLSCLRGSQRGQQAAAFYSSFLSCLRGSQRSFHAAFALWGKAVCKIKQLFLFLGYLDNMLVYHIIFSSKEKGLEPRYGCLCAQAIGVEFAGDRALPYRAMADEKIENLAATLALHLDKG